MCYRESAMCSGRVQCVPGACEVVSGECQVFREGVMC